jgi:hypothetical protein
MAIPTGNANMSINASQLSSQEDLVFRYNGIKDKLQVCSIHIGINHNEAVPTRMLYREICKRSRDTGLTSPAFTTQDYQLSHDPITL